MTMDDLITQLKHDEGFESKPYKDSVGVLTIGYGTNLEEGITEQQAHLLLICEVIDCIGSLSRTDWFPSLPNDIKFAMLNMCYNVGLPRLSKFYKTIAALKDKDWKTASEQVLKSKWARQVGERAIRISKIIAAGK